MPKKKSKTAKVKRHGMDNETPVKEENDYDEYQLLDVKEEPADSDIDEDYLEPAVSLTHNDEEEPESVSVKVELEEGDQDIDMSQSPLAMGPIIDVSTITSNTPQLALSTVKPDTPVMGGCVTPWPLGHVITVHPTLFIRTTCSKIFLPPGLYSYERSNGLVSVMSVKSDDGKFEEIEGQYFIKQADKDPHKGVSVDKMRPNTKVKRTYLSAHRRTPLQIYDEDCRVEMEIEGVARELWDEEVIKRWTNLTKEEKDKYNQKARYHGGILPGEKQKETKDIPLPALKKFAVEVAPELKKKKPYLSLIQNRGQLNRIIIDKWLKLSEVQQNKYRTMAGLSSLSSRSKRS